MANTTNLNLHKPARTDFVSVVTDINDNMDTLDGVIGAVPSGSTVQGQIGGIKGWLPSSNGTLDQVLQSNGDGTTKWGSLPVVASTSETQQIITDYTGV